MGQPAAKQGDKVIATDTHIVMIPSPGGPVPTPLPHPFVGQLDGALCQKVKIEGKLAAVQGSTATNTPSHIPQGGPFQKPPSNKGTIQMGSTKVKLEGKAAARNGDKAMTCNDPADMPVGTVVAVSKVMIGGQGVADDVHLLTDIRLELKHHALRPVYIVDVETQRLSTTKGTVLLDDLALSEGRENLGQACLIRLLTWRGELAALAHPEYGSRLHELIGRTNTPTTRNLVKLYILESLQNEPRIQKILDVTVEPVQGTRDQVQVVIQVMPISKTDTVTIGPFTLELAP